MSNRKATSAFKILSYIILALVLVFVGGFLFTYTNGFSSDFKTFYVEHNGQKIMTNINNYVVSTNEKTRFNVNYTFGFLNKSEPKAFNVKVVPNVSNNNDFDFTIDGKTYAYFGETDLTSCFCIEIFDGYFTLQSPKNMQELLQMLYPDKTVVSPKDYLRGDYFTLIISSYDGNSTLYIGFNFYVGVLGITLDKEVIYFE